MKIGGFVKQSLIDYPGKIAAVVFTQGCNFRCGYCHNPQLVLPELFCDNPGCSDTVVLDYLSKHKVWLDGVVVTGGEPTIQKDLSGFLEAVKKMGMAVKLDTNGSNPDVLRQVISAHLADYVAMDIKIFPQADEYNKVIGLNDTAELVEKVKQSISLLKQASIDIEFRTTQLPGIHDDKSLNLIKEFIGDKHYTINKFREGETVNFYKSKIR